MELGWNLYFSPYPVVAGCALQGGMFLGTPLPHTSEAVPGLHILWGLPGVLWSAQSCARGGILGALMEDLLGNHSVVKLQLQEAAWCTPGLCSPSMIKQISLVSLRAGTCAPQVAQSSVHPPSCHCSGELQRIQMKLHHLLESELLQLFQCGTGQICCPWLISQLEVFGLYQDESWNSASPSQEERRCLTRLLGWFSQHKSQEQSKMEKGST